MIVIHLGESGGLCHQVLLNFLQGIEGVCLYGSLLEVVDLDSLLEVVGFDSLLVLDHDSMLAATDVHILSTNIISCKE